MDKPDSIRVNPPESVYAAKQFEKIVEESGLEPYDRNKFPFIVASMKFDYLKQISHPEKLTIGIRVSRIGGKSFDYEYGMFKEGDDECAIKCYMTMVCFDFANQKSIPVFDALKNEI